MSSPQLLTTLALLMCLSSLPSTTHALTEETYYMMADNSTLAKVVRDDGDLTECYFFADPAVIKYLMTELDVTTQDIKRKQLRKLIKECRPVQERVIPERLRKEKKRLRDFGRGMARKLIEVNERSQKLAAQERGRRGRNNKNNRNSNKEINSRQRRDRFKRDLLPGIEILYGIYPGTIWCGAGNLADKVESDDGLGDHKEMDACCRTHDHCPISISGFSSGYGLINISPITCSECPCDESFKRCLKSATSNSPHPDIIGEIFFDVASIDCLKLEYPWKCVEYGWLGITCSEYERDTSADKVYEFYDGLTY